MNRIYNLVVPAIIFGTNCSRSIGEQIQRLGAKNILMISDPGVKKTGLVDQLNDWIRVSGIVVETYSEVEQEPSIDSTKNCTILAKKIKCDLIVGMGGGSVMDTAKAVAMMMGNDGDLVDYLGQDRIPQKGTPTILIPTTAGTGSEVGQGALFYVPKHHAKESVFSPYLLTDLAMIDPILTITAPSKVTAASGIDALCHAIESYTSRSATPLSEPYAERGIELIASNLRTAVLDGNDLSGREGMALGSLYASISLANSTSHVVHAMAYPLQGHNRIAHGLANGILLPYVLERIFQGNLKKFTRVASLMGANINGLSPSEAAQEGVKAVAQLVADIGIPAKMSQLGITITQIDQFTTEAYQIKRLMGNSPCDLSVQDIRAIFESAL